MLHDMINTIFKCIDEIFKLKNTAISKLLFIAIFFCYLKILNSLQFI